MTPEIWIFAETKGDVLHPIVGELLTPARQLADHCGGRIIALLCGLSTEDLAQELITRGADRVIVFPHPSSDFLPPETQARILSPIIQAEKPEMLLFGATSLARDLAPRLAIILNTGLMADCLSLDPSEGGTELSGTKPVPGGNLMAVITCPRHRPQMATILPGIYDPRPSDSTRTGEIQIQEAARGLSDARVRILGREENLPSAGGLEDAEIVVAGGMGLGSRENFKLVEHLARVLGGAVGATRPVVEEGWISIDHQIGQSGKIIRPRLYIAAGIYGSTFHTVGIRKAQTIVAINTDPHAPIFSLAHYALVGDAREIIPALIRRIDKTRSV